MREIIFVTPNLANGGAERVTVLLANELAKEGRSVSIAYMKDDITEYLPSSNVTVYRLFSGKSRVRRIITKIYRLRKMMKHHPNATFVAMLSFESFYTYVASLGLQCHVVYSLRNDPANMQSRMDRIVKEIIYPKAQCIVFQTEDARNYFSEAIRKKGIVIPNPIIGSLPERYEGERRKEIVTVGRLTEQKNYPLLLQAFANVNMKHPDWKLRIFGQGKLEKKLKELCRDLHIWNSVEFCGFQSNVIETINQSGIFVLSSDYEGISNAMLEALATGIPCVCTDCPVGGARAIIQDHENGILVPTRDEMKLTEAILELIEYPDLAEQLSKRAVQIRKQLSVKSITEEWRRVL